MNEQQYHFLRFRRMVVGELQTNCYLVFHEKSRDAIVIDPGADGDAIIQEIRQLNLKPRRIVLTHSHLDHTGGVNEVSEMFSIPVLVHSADAADMNSPLNREMALMLGVRLPKKTPALLEHNEYLDIGGSQLKIIHTPGHSPGSVCFVGEGLLFSGDTLFAGSIGRTDLPGGNFTELQKSLNILKQLPDSTRVLPGHGDISDMGREKKFNPYM